MWLRVTLPGQRRGVADSAAPSFTVLGCVTAPPTGRKRGCRDAACNEFWVIARLQLPRGEIIDPAGNPHP